ncbi:MAG: hypothetical protein JSS62_05020 [Verrucomicrobia bacterium]|nr:hypothetical protein [Verrucomicrobiota bacterium]MBS0647491.1 hypothetical protein [Verrucomicrobiota bacterium]
MKKIKTILLTFLAMASPVFATTITLDNETSYPSQHPNSKIAIQWASSAQEVNEDNQALMCGCNADVDPQTLHTLNQSRKIAVELPNSAEYFRVLVWSKGEGGPDLLTNWVDVVPNKTYALEEDHLVPTVLMPGTGC